MKTIETYSDYLIAVRDQTATLRVVKSEAIHALNELKKNNPDKYAEYKARSEEIKPAKPRGKKETVNRPRRQTLKYRNMSLQEIRQKVREKLYGDACWLHVPSWITKEDASYSIYSLEIDDMLTASGNLASAETLRRRCIKRAATEGRIDENKLRQTILSHCIQIMNTSKVKYPYSSESLKWFIMKVASAEELANANMEFGISISKVVNLMFDKRIPKLNIEELKDNEREKTIEKLKQEKPLEIRKLAKKAWNYIQKRNQANDGYPLPDDCKTVDLKYAIDKIDDDELYAAFDGKRIDADKLYDLCMKVINPVDNSQINLKNMNAQGRKTIEKYIATLEEIKDNLEAMRDEEEEKYDNMPEGLQESERGEAMQEAIEALETASDGLDEVISGLQEIV